MGKKNATYKAKKYIKFSKSSIELYLTCRLAYAFQYILKPPVKRQVTILMALGDALHYIFKKYIIENFTTETIISHWIYYWTKEFKKEIIPDELFQKDNMTGIGIKIIKAYCSFIQPYKELYSYRKQYLKKYIKPCFHAESTFEAEFENYILSGRFDLLLIKPGREELEIILFDYKTGYGEPSWQEKMVNIQFDIYQWAIIKLFGINPKYMAVCYFDRQHQVFSKSIVLIRSNRNYQELKKLLDEISNNIQKALYEENFDAFEPTRKQKDIGKHCRSCNYHKECKEFIESKLSLTEYIQEFIEPAIKKYKESQKSINYEQLSLFPPKSRKK